MERFEKVQNMNKEELGKFLFEFFIGFQTEHIVCGDRVCEEVQASPEKSSCCVCIEEYLSEEVD